VAHLVPELGSLLAARLLDSNPEVRQAAEEGTVALALRL